LRDSKPPRRTERFIADWAQLSQAIYGDAEIHRKNFAHCEYRDLARLCDEVKSGSGLSTRLDEFEKTFFSLADW
jgi:hypothetical protein